MRLFANFTNRAGLSGESGIVQILRNALTKDDVWISPTSDADPDDKFTWIKSDTVKAGIGLFPSDTDSRTDHYDHISLGLLWPLMHELKDRVDNALENMRFENTDEGRIAVYDTRLEALEARAANYAKHIAFSNDRYNTFKADGRISLVHDFTCAGIRSASADVNVYTMHTPFPRAEWLEKINVDDTPLIETRFFRDLVERLASYDLITMHTDKDVDNFANVMKAVAPDFALAPDGRFTAFGRTSVVKKVHVGIDPAFIRDEAEHAALGADTQHRFFDKIAGRKAVLSVSRHDYTKGTRELAETIDAYFTAHPERVKDTTFVVIRQASRGGLAGQTQYQKDCDQNFAGLMEKYSDAVIYENNGMKHPELMKFMALPNVVAVTALPTINEGHDLTVREFVDINQRDSAKAILATRGVGAMSVLGVSGPNGEHQGAFHVESCTDTDEIVKYLDIILSGDHDDEVRARFNAMKDRSSHFTGRHYLDEIGEIVDHLGDHEHPLPGNTVCHPTVLHL